MNSLISRVLHTIIPVLAIAMPMGAHGSIPDAMDRTFPQPDPDEQSALNVVGMGLAAPNAESAIIQFDRALDIAAKPTPFRGFLQCARGVQLSDLDRQNDMKAAFEECLILLPDNARARLAYSNALLGNFQNDDDLRYGVDLMLEGVRRRPALIDEIPLELARSAIRRLTYLHDDDRIVALVEVVMTGDFGSKAGEENDALLLTGILAALNSGKIENARSMIPLLKRRQSLAALRTAKVAQPIWENLDAYRTGGFIYRLQDFDRSTSRAMTINPSPAVATPRISALIELGRYDDAASVARESISEWYAQGRPGETLYDVATLAGTAASRLIHAGHAELALPLGYAMLADLNDDEIAEILNFTLNQADWRMLYGDRESGLSLFRRADRVWARNTDRTEGRGGELFMLALRSCDTKATDADVNFRNLAKEQSANASAYRVALECRNDVKGLSAQVIQRLSERIGTEEIELIRDLRAISTGTPSGMPPIYVLVAQRTDVRAVLDRVSVSAENLP